MERKRNRGGKEVGEETMKLDVTNKGKGMKGENGHENWSERGTGRRGSGRRNDELGVTKEGK